MFPDSFILYAYTAMGLSLTFPVVIADAVRYGRRIDEPSTARTVRVGLVSELVLVSQILRFACVRLTYIIRGIASA